MVEGMRAAGLDPAFVYAFENTGLLVTEQNQHLIPEKDLAEWGARPSRSTRGSSAKGSARALPSRLGAALAFALFSFPAVSLDPYLSIFPGHRVIIRIVPAFAENFGPYRKVSV